MLEIIAVILLTTSFLGLLILFFIKIPALKKIESPEVFSDRVVLSSLKKLKEKIVFLKNKKSLRLDFWNIFLQKILSKIKVVSLQLETRCSRLLERIREREKERKENERYWDQIGGFSIKKPKKKKTEEKPK